MTYTYKDDIVTQWAFKVARLLNPRRVSERARWTDMLWEQRNPMQEYWRGDTPYGL